MRGPTEVSCRQKLRRHLLCSSKHNSLQAEGPAAIERVVSRAEVKWYGPRTPRERSRSRDDSLGPPPSEADEFDGEPEPAEDAEPAEDVADETALQYVLDEWILVPREELELISIALDVAARTIRARYNYSRGSIDV